jgi:hypothetical protein
MPPPRIPAEVVDGRPPSVLVTPLPATPLNLPLILAKALGEKMRVPVGPTLIVGDVARIDVPNRSVEKRALDIGSFYCLGMQIKILFNDRIIDNTRFAQSQKRKFQTVRDRLRTDQPAHMDRVKYSPDKSSATNTNANRIFSSAGPPRRPPPPGLAGEDPRFQNFRPRVPPTFGDAQHAAGVATVSSLPASGAAAAAAAKPPVVANIGVVSDSEDSSSDASSRSSSSSDSDSD